VLAEPPDAHGDVAAAARLARATGAAWVVFGRLLRAGGDSVRATASLYDAAAGRVRADVEARDARGRLDQLTDSLTVDLLRALDERVPITAVGHGALRATPSLDALKAYLEGERHYRRAEWEEATRSYQRAVALDDGYALAHRRLGAVLGWRRLVSDPAAMAHLLRAGARNRGLGTRDSLLVAADSLRAAADAQPTYLEEWPYVRRLFATLDEARRQFPDDAEVWFALGEARYHFGTGPVLGASDRTTLATFDRALALDPGFAPAYAHTPELALTVGGPPLALRYADAWLRRAPGDSTARATRVLARLLREPLLREPRAFGRAVDSVPPEVLLAVRTAVRRWPDSAETAVRLLRHLLASPGTGRGAAPGDTAALTRLLVEQLAFRGHLREAHRLVGERDAFIAFELALLGGAPPAVADARVARLVAAESRFASLALGHWAARRDTAPLAAFLARARARARSAAGAAARQAAAYDTAAALAHLALARADSGGALARLAALPDTACARCYPHRLTRALLRIAGGELAAAHADLSEVLVAQQSPFEVLFALERGTVAERMGRRDEAAAAYAFVAAAWARGDPEVRPQLERARAGLARLGRPAPATTLAGGP
jgi:serine/threonine-protein kinase